MIPVRLLCLIAAFVSCGLCQDTDPRSAIDPPNLGFPQLFDRNWNASLGKFVIEYNLETFGDGLLQALGTLNDYTCISFVISATPSVDHMLFSESPNATCEPSAFGRQNTGQTHIVFRDDCTDYEILRILLANIGLYYMHQRPDRNAFVTFSPSSPTGNLFDIPSSIQLFGLPYDYTSAMSTGRLPMVNISDIVTGDVLSDTNGISDMDQALLFQLYSHENCTAEIPCNLTTCENGGTCFEKLMGRPICVCTALSTGEYCEIKISVCDNDTSLCFNGGSCYDGDDEVAFTCRCPEGFVGDRCEIQIYCDGWFDAGNGYQYMVTSQQDIWYGAMVQCMMYGAQLAHKGIRDEHTFEKLGMQYRDYQRLWVGLSAKQNFNFRYIDMVEEDRAKAPFVSGLSIPNLIDGRLCVAMTSSLFSPRILKRFDCKKSLNFYGLCEKPIVNPALDGYNQGNGKTYFLTPSPTGFAGAESQCNEAHAHLAVLATGSKSQLEDVIDAIVEEASWNVYLGYEAVKSMETYKALYTLTTDTIDGSSSRWAAGEPAPSGEKCTASNQGLDGKLRSVPCAPKDDTFYYGLCEIAELPETAFVDCPDGNSCPNGICVKECTTGRFACLCNAGYVKEDSVCTDFNECLMNPCMSGVCVNHVGYYTCV